MSNHIFTKYVHVIKDVFYVAKDGNKAGCVLLAVCGVLIICIRHLKYNACTSVMSTELKKKFPTRFWDIEIQRQKKCITKKLKSARPELFGPKSNDLQCFLVWPKYHMKYIT